MTRRFLAAGVLLLAASAAWANAARVELAREILRGIPDWPGTQVEIPIEVYADFVRESVTGPVPPQPPEVVWIERAAWRVKIGDPDVSVEPVFEIISLPGEGSRSVRLLPGVWAWRDATLDGNPVELRRDAKDGWFYIDIPMPGRYRVTAKAVVKPNPPVGDVWRIAIAGPKAAWNSGSVDADGAWEVRFTGAPLPILGDEKGTRGTVGLLPRDAMEVSWQRPKPPVHREARIEADSQIGWTLGDGVHQVRAVVDLRLWGGEVEELRIDLPTGADRVAITGPDVREVQLQAGAGRIFLRGKIGQRTRLSISYEVPRPKTGKMSFPAFGVQGAAGHGGNLAIGGGAGAVLLELETPGLAGMALHDVPDSVGGLLSSPPVFAYEIGRGQWDARIDLVDMAEFPVRETLVDSALYTVLYRPDGQVMAKVLYEVRNRGQQYMRVDLPAGARLVVARVAEQQRNLARGPGDTVYVPLEKSVLTTAGLISFPVELVYMMRGPALSREGELRLPLPRTDLPVAYARCALMLPDGLRVREWQGTLRQVPTWSSEAANVEFEYGSGHLAVQPKPEAPKPGSGKVKGGGGSSGGLFGLGAQPAPAPEETPTKELAAPEKSEGERTLTPQEQILQGRNSYRAGVDFYNRGDYRRAGDLFKQTVEAAPASSEAENAKKYLGNITIALGDTDGDAAKGDRGLRAATKAIQLSQQAGNVEILHRQQELIQQAEQAARSGEEGRAEAAYKVAVDIAQDLQSRGEAAKEQSAVTRKARQFLEERDRKRQAGAEQVAELQKQVQSLKQSITAQGGQEAAQVVEALVEPTNQLAPIYFDNLSISGAMVAAPGPKSAAAPAKTPPAPDTFLGGPPAQAQRQVQFGRALAEQQVTFGSGAVAAGQRKTKKPAAQSFQYEAGAVVAGDQVQQLQQQVEELKAIRSELAQSADGITKAGAGTLTAGTLTLTTDGHATTPLSTDLSRKVAEKAKSLAADAQRASELAKLGRLAEADALLRDVERQQAVTTRAAEAIAKFGAYKALSPRPAGEPQGGAVAAGHDMAGLWRSEDEHRREAAVRDESRPVTLDDGAAADLWSRATKARDERDFEGARTAVGAVLAARPQDEKARRWLEDLLYLMQNRGAVSLLKYPESSVGGDALATGYKRGHGVSAEDPVAVRSPATPDGSALDDARKKLAMAREELTRQTRELGRVQFDVSGIAQADGDERRLADFVTSNYGWALRGTHAQVRGTSGRLVTTYSGGTTINADAVTDFNGEATVQVTNGNLAVINDPAAVSQVHAVIDRLRANLGQRVGVGSRNVFVDARAAQAAGIKWEAGANGVRYSVVNEGQLLGVLDIEQRQPPAPQAASLPREARQDAVVGTSALIANGGVVSIANAADEANGFVYNGNNFEVAHEDYLMIDNGGYLTAVKSSRMRHWAAEAEPVRFPGVPAVVTIPAVGWTVKFEKTLLDASDSLELVTEYTWQGEEK